MPVGVVRHHGCENAPVGPFAGTHGPDDIRLAPLAEPCLGVGRQIRRLEIAEFWDVKAHLRAAQCPFHVGLAQEHPRSVAAGTVHDRREILAALEAIVTGHQWKSSPDTSGITASRTAAAIDRATALFTRLDVNRCVVLDTSA